MVSQTPAWYREVETAVGARPISHAPLSGGCIAPVYRVEMAGGGWVVVKTGGGEGAGSSSLGLEGGMLRYLGENSELPVPRVHHASDDLLVMEYLPGSGNIDRAAEEPAAELLAALHEIRGWGFGFDHATVIGSLHQPNPWTASWVDFFRDHRLLHMARDCHEAGDFDAATMTRLERLAGKLDGLIDEPDHPSLIHGDMWTGNVLVKGGRVTGFVDPAIYYANAEIELAFATLFGTFREPFFARYGEIRPIAPGFFEVRRDIYNLWHLLNHVRLFGGSYLAGVRRVLDRHGC